MFRSNVHALKKTWHVHIHRGFDLSHSEPYCKAYLDLIRVVAERKNGSSPFYGRFLSRVLAFENFVLRFRNASSAFAAATTSFRNPAFLSFHHRGLRKHNRNDPSLLPLIVAMHQDVPALFYHYRKQRILKNTDDNLLFFPVVDLKGRPASFRGFDVLTKILLSEWDSRIEQRSRLLANKVVVPLLTKVPTAKTGARTRALRILDIGSGVGLFTSKVIARILKSGVLGSRRIELSLLDILTVDPKRHFSSASLLPGLAKVQYISSDYVEWFSTACSNRAVKFDIVFLFRILHNLSLFRIGAAPPKVVRRELAQSSYPMFRHLSDYYHAILRLFPQVADQKAQMSLLTPGGTV